MPGAPVGGAEPEQVEHVHAEALGQERSDAPPRPRGPWRAVHHHHRRPVAEPVPGDLALVARKALTQDPLGHPRHATRCIRGTAATDTDRGHGAKRWSAVPENRSRWRRRVAWIGAV